MNTKNNLYFIIEEAYTPIERPKIIEEKKTADNKYKLIFKTILQEADVRNNNRRIYPKEVLKEIVNQLSPKAKNRALFGELDHPWVESTNEDLIKKRASQIRLSEACVLYRDIKFDGKYVIAECETLTTAKGLDLFALLKDNANIGFSLRAFGPVKPDTTTNSLIVNLPIKAITYDVVSNPSHQNARILEFLSEDINLFIPFNKEYKEKVSLLFENENVDLKQKTLQEIIFTSIPFGAIIKDIPDDELPDEIKQNENLKKISIKIDTDENQIVICKNNSCIFKDLDEFIDDIINMYFDEDKECKKSIPITYPEINKCTYKPLFSNTFSFENIYKNYFENEETKETNTCASNCPIVEDIDFIEFISNINEEKIDSLLLKLFKNDLFEIYEEYEALLSEDEIENMFKDAFKILKEIKLDEDDNETNIYEDEDYLDLSYKKYMKFLVEEILNEIEPKINTQNALKIYQESFNDIICELNTVPDILYELSLIDEKYENEPEIKINKSNEKLVDIALSYEIQNYLSEIEEFVDKDIKLNSTFENKNYLKDLVINHTLIKDILMDN